MSDKSACPPAQPAESASGGETTTGEASPTTVEDGPSGRADTPCSCGCGMPAENRGGYNSRLDVRVWFATVRCAARFETALIQIRNGPAAKRGIAAIHVEHVQKQVRKNYPTTKRED